MSSARTRAPVNHSRRNFIRGVGAGTGALLLTASDFAGAAGGNEKQNKQAPEPKGWPWSKSVAADPTHIPAPITRDHSQHHEIELVGHEIEGKLDDGTTIEFMTWNDQVPGPMIRLRQDDTVNLTMTNAADNSAWHNVDLHAVYGTGGGSKATSAKPGESASIRFICHYPGAFLYHCAVRDVDMHISLGMFGMILVEPHGGLPKVDREFYLGQHEIYTQQPFGTPGRLDFSDAAALREQPEYVLFNGAVNGFTKGRLGRMQAKVGETARVFMASGGPNLLSSFHAIGNVWARCWPQGGLANEPLRYIQTQPTPPGSCFVGDLELPVPETIHLVDHAMTRDEQKGLMAEIEVSGPEQPDLFKAVE